MPLEKPEPGYVWLHVPRKEPADVVVVGDVHSWWSHWTGVPGGRQTQGVRCIKREAGECAWCEQGYEDRVRYVFPVLLGTDLRLVELGRVQYPMLSMLVQEGGWLGRRLRLVREWDAKNARIQVRPIGREHVSPEQVVDVSQYVEELGKGQLALMRVPQSAIPSKRPEAVRERSRGGDR